MDLTTGWDFRRQDHKDKAWEYVDRCKPKLLIGSPMCSAFSTTQNIHVSRMSPEDVEGVKAYGRNTFGSVV